MARTPVSAARKTNGKKNGAAPVPTPLPERVANLSDLRPHPRNYKKHPVEQLLHIEESLRQHGVYRNVVVARDNTILAGHGVVEAAIRAGMTQIPVRTLNVAPDSPQALKLLAADNELGRFAESDDRALTEMLKEISKDDLSGLLGTGYDDKMLAALVMVTRPASEIRDINEAAEWVGMPEYDAEGDTPTFKLVVTFKTEADRKRFVDTNKLRIDKFERMTWSTKWPFVEREDVAGVRFETEAVP